MDARPFWRSGFFQDGAALWALVPFSVGIVITITILVFARNQQRWADQLRLEQQDQRISKLMESRLAGYEDLLRGAHAFCRRGEGPTKAEWKVYSDEIGLQVRHPGLKTLVRVERVPDHAWRAFLAEHKPDGFSTEPCVVRSLHPSDRALPPGAEDHLVITLAEPSASASRALGLDVGTSAYQRDAAERSAGTGRPALTGPLQFRSDGVPTAAVAIFYPQYRSESEPTTPEARRRDVAGWVSLGVYLDAFLQSVEQGGDEGIATEIFDLTEGQPIRLYPQAGPSLEELTKTRKPHLIDAFGRTWGLISRPLPAFFAGSQRNRGPQILLTGLVASLSLAAIFWSLASTRNRAHRLADQLTRSVRAALRRLDTLIESTPVGVVEWDARLRVRRWNPAAGRIFGCGPDAVTDDSSIWRRVPGLGGDMPRTSLQEVLKQARPISGPQEAIRQDGQRITCEWTSSPIYDADGRVDGVLSFVMDVTEQRRTEERAWLQQKLETLGVMAGGIAHDFNNLLWAITGNAELARDYLPEHNPARENLARIEAAAFRASELARQMLAFSGRAPFLMVEMNLGEAISGMEDTLRSGLAPDIWVEFEIHPDLPRVRADQSQLQQALRNLLVNAAEAMAAGNGLVQLKVFPVATEGVHACLVPGSNLADGPAICIEIRDNGTGMNPEILGKVFDPFFTTKATGRGLGLSATLGIMRAHGGGVALDSVPGQGTRVRLYFPALQEASRALPPEPPVEVRTGGSLILLAEDEDVLRELTLEALEPAGFNVIAVEDGLKALEVFEARGAEIALVVLDLNMPRMGGMEAFRRIRSLDPTVKVLLSSGFAEEEIGDLGGDLQPDGFLHKPYRLKELLLMVREMIP